MKIKLVNYFAFFGLKLVLLDVLGFDHNMYFSLGKI